MTKESVYRSGNLLVMHKNALLPDRCVKSNNPANGCRIKKRVHHTNPIMIFLYVAWQIAIINGYLPFVGWPLLIALFFLGAHLTKRAEIQLGVSEKLRKKKKLARKVSGVFFLVALVSIAVGVVFVVTDLDQVHIFYSLFGVGSLALIIGLFANVDNGLSISLKKWKGDYLWLCGVGGPFLDSLPDWDQREQIK